MLLPHIPEERCYAVATGRSTLSETEFGHLRNCQECIDAVANMTRQFIERRQRDGESDGATH